MEKFAKVICSIIVILASFFIGMGLNISNNNEQMKTSSWINNTSVHNESTTKKTTEKESTTVPLEPMTIVKYIIEDEAGYTKKEEIVFATTDVNVRNGAGTGNTLVGVLKKNDSVIRLAVGNNGWSKVVFNDVICYISSEYLTTDTPA